MHLLSIIKENCVRKTHVSLNYFCKRNLFNNSKASMQCSIEAVQFQNADNHRLLVLSNVSNSTNRPLQNKSC